MICAVTDGGICSQAETSVILCPLPLLPFPFLACLSGTTLSGARASPTSISLSWVPLLGTWLEAALVAENGLGGVTGAENLTCFLFVRKTSSAPDVKSKLVLSQLLSHFLQHGV